MRGVSARWWFLKQTTGPRPGQSCWGKPRFRPPCDGSSHRLVMAFSRGEEVEAVRAVGLGVAEQRRLPAAERVVGDGHGDRHVDADHADLHLALEPPRGAAVVREDRRAVAVEARVDDAEPLFVPVDAHDREHRAEDLVLCRRRMSSARCRSGSGRARSRPGRRRARHRGRPRRPTRRRCRRCRCTTRPCRGAAR